MKKIKIHNIITKAMCLAVLPLLAGCTAESLADGDAGEATLSPLAEATVTAEIAGEGTATRAGGSLSDESFPEPGGNLDGTDGYIIVSAVSYADGTPLSSQLKEAMSGKKYRHIGNGAFIPADRANAMVFYNEKPVKFMAYYPHLLVATVDEFSHEFGIYDTVLDDWITDVRCRVTTGRATHNVDPSWHDGKLDSYFAKNEISGENFAMSQTAGFHSRFSNVLRAEGAVASVKDPNISFTGDAAFFHRMSKYSIEIDVKSFSEFSGKDCKIEDIVLSPIEVFAAYDPVTDDYDIYNGSSIYDQTLSELRPGFVPAGTQDRVRVEDIFVIPQSVWEFYFTIKVSVGGVSNEFMTDVLENFEFEKGKKYEFTITKDESDIARITGCRISDWKDGGGKNIDVGVGGF